ncbi:glutamate mutase L [Thermogemmatispora sp.]|uniref:glutamate mutase L n=1 Tax=Thermogemmatispora sp. TaxID=1968838 RepID=UPI001D8EA3CD|nr:glutamate mutase L [Thermogemmatispora sp.]MBX5449055.1 glutamate mutase L [Thermogemmatispora sp.]
MQTQLNQQEGQAAAHRKEAAAANSILVADCGSVLTKVSLLGLVEGQYRLMARGEAPTTLAAPQEDITRGIVQAINEIELVTGRQIIVDGHLLVPEQLDGNGVDVFVTTISAGGPLRLVVLGAASPTLTDLVRQAVSGLYAELHALPSPTFSASMAAGQLSQPGSTPLPGVGPAPWTPERLALEWRRQIDRLRELQPHAAIIVGMADGPTGATPIQEACQLLLNAAHEQREKTRTFPLPVLYAAAPQYVEASRRLINGAGEVMRLDPLVSTANLGPISMAASSLYERTILRRLPGSDTLWSWSAAAPVATATSLSSLVRFLAHHYTMNVMAVDAGGANTTLLLAGERGEFIPLVNAGIGVGSGLGELLKRVGSQNISRWLPFDVSDEELRQFVLNTMLHPHVVPSNQRELHISQAFAREAILLTAEALRTGALSNFSPDLILATGSVLAHAPRPAQAALILLDALQPRGVTSLVLDRTLLFQQLGAIATVNPVAAVQVNENDAVTHRLGTCVIPYGALPPDQIALRVVVEYSNGRQVQVEVMSGSIEVIPLRLNEQALLTLYPASTVDVGLGPGERARAAEEIDGGLVGLIIDARGRPLMLPADKAERQARLLQWSQAIGA